MSSQDWGFGVPNASSDAYIQKNYPAVELKGTETPLGAHTETREVNGSVWRVINAQYNGELGGFQQVNTSLVSVAFVVSPGTITFKTAPVGAPAPIAWVSSTIPTSIPAGLNNIIDVTLPPYDADPTGVLDSTAAIQAAINALTPGQELVAIGKFQISSTLIIGNGGSSQISTIGNNTNYTGGGGSYESIVAGDTGTTFTWSGAVGGTMLRILGPIRGVRMSGMLFDGAAIAGTGIETLQNTYGIFSDVWTVNTQNLGWYIHAISANPAGFTNGANGVQYFSCGASRITGGATPTGIQVGEPDYGATIPDPIFQNFFGSTVRMDGVAGGIGLSLRFTDGCNMYGGVIAAETPLLITPNVTTGAGVAAGNFPSAWNFYGTEIVQTAPGNIGTVVTGTWNPVTSIGFWPWIEENGESESGLLPMHHGFKGFTDGGQLVGSQAVGRITGDYVENPPVQNTTSEVVFVGTSALSSVEPCLYPNVLGRNGDSMRVRVSGLIVANAAGTYHFKLYIGQTTATIGSAIPAGYTLMANAAILVPSAGSFAFFIDIESAVSNLGTPTAQQLYSFGIVSVATGSGTQQTAAIGSYTSAAFNSKIAYENLAITVTMQDALSSVLKQTFSLDVTHSAHSIDLY